MKLGVAVRHLGASQLNYHFIRGANALLADQPTLDIVAFTEAPQRPCLTPHFASMQVAEGWGYDGPVVATTLRTAEKVVRFPSCPRKLFYVWDLEWLRQARKSYAELRAVYQNPSLTLLVRCSDHAKAIRNCWGREAEVVEDFDLKRLLEIAHALPAQTPDSS